jgi:hypothetical protein
MNARINVSRVLIIVGMLAMLFGSIDPLEGSFVILPGVGVVALGAIVGKSRHSNSLCWSFALVALGVAGMIVLSWLGGIGGNSGHSTWWAIVLLPYPVGWLTGLIGAVRSLIESRQFRALRPGNS